MDDYSEAGDSEGIAVLKNVVVEGIELRKMEVCKVEVHILVVTCQAELLVSGFANYSR